MEKEHKDLVITDLCGRLPHKVIVEFISYKGEEKPWIGELSCKDLDCFIHDVGFVEIKPYLFPISSMTTEQRREYTRIANMYGNLGPLNWQAQLFKIGSIKTISIIEVLFQRDWQKMPQG